jgi:hypothetical protein
MVALVRERAHELNDPPQQVQVHRLARITLVSQDWCGADYFGNHPMFCFEHFGWAVRDHVVSPS